MAEPISEKQIFNACRVLFGPDIHLTHDFLHYLQPGGAKSGYRRQAKRLHPDLHGGDPRLQRRQAELFRELVEAQELILAFLDLRDSGRWPGPRRAGAGRRSGPQPPRRGGPSRPRSQSAARDRSRSHQGEGWHFSGPVPTRYLEIGLFLFYRGLVSFSDLIAALVWQRRQRPALGDIARRWGWLDEASIMRIVTDTGHMGRFGERAIELGLLNAFQVQTLLHFQRSQQQRLGQYFVNQGYISRAEMESLVDELVRHNARVLARERRWSSTA